MIRDGQGHGEAEALMDRTDKVHIKWGPGTDITFSIKGIPCYGMHGNKNIPDGEVYTAPVKDSVNEITYNTLRHMTACISECSWCLRTVRLEMQFQ